MSGEVWINDVDLGDFGYVLGVDPAQADSPIFQDDNNASTTATAILLGQIGPVWTGEPVQAEARPMTIGGFCTGISPSDYLAKMDGLKSLASKGAVRLRFADRPTQEFRDARLLEALPTPRAAILSALSGDITLRFQLADPLRYDILPQGVGLSTMWSPLPLGTAPAFPLVTINGGGGSLVNPVLTLRNAAGDPVQTMGFTGTLGAGDFLVIDCARTTITKSVSGTQSNALSWWTSGDFLVVRPIDAGFDESAWPTLSLSGGRGLVSYARAWL